MSDSAKFIANFGTDRQRKGLLKFPDGRFGLASSINKRYGVTHADNSEHMGAIADHLHKEFHKPDRTHPTTDWDRNTASLVLERGNDEHRKKIADTVLPEESGHVLKSLMRYGTDEDRDRFIDRIQDGDTHTTIAKYGNDKHRDKLIDKDDHYIQSAIAQHGNDSHREKLKDNYHPDVKNTVAEYGNKEHRDHVFKYAMDYPTHYGRTIKAVAEKGTNEQRQRILDHGMAQHGHQSFHAAVGVIKKHPDATKEQRQFASMLENKIEREGK